SFYDRMYRVLGPATIVASRLGLQALTAAERVRRQIFPILDDVIARRRAGAFGDETIIDVLARSEHPSGRPLTTDEIIGCSLQFMFAAHMPVSAAFPWVGYELARHPEWLERLRADVAAASADERLTYAAYKRLDSLSWVVQETLRLHSPAVF